MPKSKTKMKQQAEIEDVGSKRTGAKKTPRSAIAKRGSVKRVAAPSEKRVSARKSTSTKRPAKKVAKKAARKKSKR